MNNWNIRSVLHWSYWLKQPLTARDEVAWLLWLGMVALLGAGILGLFLYSYGKHRELRKIWYELGMAGFAGGLYGLLWMFFRQQRIPLWSLRLWLLPMAALFIWRAYRAYRFYSKRLPAIKDEHKKEALRQRYLPKPSKN